MIQEQEFDVLLLSPWSEQVFVNPAYQLIREEMGRCSQILSKQKLQDYFKRYRETDESVGNLLPFWDQHFYSQRYAPYTPGLLSLAAVLETAGYRVKCMSLDIARKPYADDPDWLEKCLKPLCEQTRLAVGITSVTAEYARALAVLDRVRECAPHLKTLIGGTHVTYLPEDAIRHPSVDAVVVGEGETAITELVQAWEAGEPIHGIKGTVNLIDGKVFKNPPQPLLDMTKVPRPAYHLLDEEMKDGIKLTPTYSRGCPYACDYCVESHFWERKVRHRDAEAFAAELKYLADELGWRFIHIADSTFGINRAATIALCDAIEKLEIDAMFSVNLRPEARKYLGEDLLKRLVSLGFVEMYLGAETADPALLKALNRNQAQDSLISTLTFLKEIGVPFVKLYLMVGLPEDTHEGLQTTINTVRELIRRDLVFYATAKFFVPTPGTPLFTDTAISGTKDTAEPWFNFERYNFPPFYEHEHLSALEQEHYLLLIQSIQLSAYREKLGLRADEALPRLRDWAAEHYLRRLYT